MSTLSFYLKSSIGKKTLMGLTGLVWSGFVLTHMLGNMLILVSPEAYNHYGHALVSNPLLPIAEAFLVLNLLVHFFCGIKLTIENRCARPDRYKACTKDEKAASVASKTMAYTGSLIMVFIILHIITFKYGTFYPVTYGGVEMRDLHRLIVEVFHDTRYVAWYLVCLVLLGFHLSHGFASSFQSLGFRHPKYTCTIKIIGKIYAIVVALGFISQPLYLYFLRQ